MILRHGTRGRCRQRPGLSLIEVLLSVAIFFMAIVAISRLVDMGTDTELQARLNSTGSRLAQSVLAQVEAGIIPMDSSQGEFSDADAGWTWTLTAPLQSTNLYNVTVTVTRNFKGQSFSITMSQMILDPTVKGVAGEVTRPDQSGTSP